MGEAGKNRKREGAAGEGVQKAEVGGGGEGEKEDDEQRD